MGRHFFEAWINTFRFNVEAWIIVTIMAAWFGVLAFYPYVAGRYLLGMKTEEAERFRDRNFIPKMAKLFFWLILVEMGFAGGLAATDFVSTTLAR